MAVRFFFCVCGFDCDASETLKMQLLIFFPSLSIFPLFARARFVVHSVPHERENIVMPPKKKATTTTTTSTTQRKSTRGKSPSPAALGGGEEEEQKEEKKTTAAKRKSTTTRGKSQTPIEEE